MYIYVNVYICKCIYIKEIPTYLGRWIRWLIMLLSQSWKDGSWNNWSLMDDDLGWENIPISVRNRSTAALRAAYQYTWPILCGGSPNRGACHKHGPYQVGWWGK